MTTKKMYLEETIESGDVLLLDVQILSKQAYFFIFRNKRSKTEASLLGV